MTQYDTSFYDALEHTALPAAKAVLRIAHDMRPFESLCDVGCGRGTWLIEAAHLGVTKLVGWDGPWVPAHPTGWLNEALPDADAGVTIALIYKDLEQRIDYRAERFDVALCLEVAEHLSKARAGSLVEDLCSLSDRVIFSAAIPGQGGVGHVNEQPHSYWIHLFGKHGYRPDHKIRHLLSPIKNIPWWYTQNIMEFVK